MESKLCAKCGQCKPLTEFSRRGGYSMKGFPLLNSNCKECRNVTARQVVVARLGKAKAGKAGETSSTAWKVPAAPDPEVAALCRFNSAGYGAVPGVAPQARAW